MDRVLQQAILFIFTSFFDFTLQCKIFCVQLSGRIFCRLIIGNKFYLLKNRVVFSNYLIINLQ